MSLQIYQPLEAQFSEERHTQSAALAPTLYSSGEVSVDDRYAPYPRFLRQDSSEGVYNLSTRRIRKGAQVHYSVTFFDLPEGGPDVRESKAAPKARGFYIARD